MLTILRVHGGTGSNRLERGYVMGARKKKPDCPFYGKDGHEMLNSIDSSRGNNQCALRLDGVVPCAMEVLMNETPNDKTCPLIKRVREVWSLMEIAGLDDTGEEFVGMEMTISIVSVQQDEGEDDLPVGATQCPRCGQLYAGVFCPNCFMQSGVARLK